MFAFCVFRNQLHLAHQDGAEAVIPVPQRDQLFPLMRPFLRPCQQILTTTGPMPFTMLRMVRAVQLGLCMGWKAEKAWLVNLFDVLAPEDQDRYCLALASNRGDFFTRCVENGTSTEVMMKELPADCPVLCDDPQRSTMEVGENLAKRMLTRSLPRVDEVSYMLTPEYVRKGTTVKVNSIAEAP